jgi:DNA-binding FrmR family transcriptional regulator
MDNVLEVAILINSIASLGGLVSALAGLHTSLNNGRKLNEVKTVAAATHDAANSKMDQLIQLTATSSYDQGVRDEKERSESAPPHGSRGA